MGISRTRLGVMMAIACFCFGCKGAGGAFRVLGAVAVTAVRVAAVAAATAPSHGSEGSVERETYIQAPPPPPEEARMASAHPRCIELAPAPELPGDAIAVRTMACGGRVMVQDGQSGLWREHR